MIDYEYFELFQNDSVDKQWKIEYTGGAISNEDLFSQSIELTESLCSEKELRFGSCEASVLKFKVANIVRPLINTWLTVSVIVDNHTDVPLMIGKYKVTSDKPTADRRHREIIAYDAMYEIIGADVAPWYNSVLPEENSSMTLRQFRESFMRHFDLEWVVPEGGLANDRLTVKRTIEPEQISGLDMITAICEINGCFGHIGRDGKFHFVCLPQSIQGLYPRNDLYPKNDLFPVNPKSSPVGRNKSYIKCEYEDFITKGINKLQIRQTENDIGIIYPDKEQSENDNCYIVEDNFLVYGKSHQQLQDIAINLYEKIIGIEYRPYTLENAGNPCYELGDAIRIVTAYELIESYILKRTLKGIQALRDNFAAEGKEKYTDKVNGVHRSILQLKKKTNEIVRTVDETRSTITDLEKGLRSEITQTAGQIRLEVENTKEELVSSITQTTTQIRTEISNTKSGLESSITQTAKDIRAEIKSEVDGLSSSISQSASQIRLEIKDTSDNLQSKITQTAKDIKSEIAQSYETKTNAESQYQKLSTSITQTANSIKSEVSETYETKNNASSQYSSLQSSITQTANGIKTEVSNTYQTKTAASTQYTTLNSRINQTSESITTEVNRAKGAEGTLSTRITQNATAIESKVSNSEFGTKITQSASSVQIAWNNISKYVQFQDGELRIYDSNDASKQKLVSVFNKDGTAFWRNGYKRGSMGVVSHAYDTSKLGLQICSEPYAKFITFTQIPSTSSTHSNVMLTFSHENGMYDKYGMHLGCELFTHGYAIEYDYSNFIMPSAEGIAIRATSSFNVGVGGNSIFYANPTGMSINKLDMYGSIDMHGNSILNQSDIRLKENISPMEVKPLKVITAIELKQFDWRESKKHEEIGMIAQQVNEVCRELVEISNEGIYSLKMEKFIPYLIGAVQELSRMIKDQQPELFMTKNTQKRDSYTDAEKMYTQEEIEKAIAATKMNFPEYKYEPEEMKLPIREEKKYYE